LGRQLRQNAVYTGTDALARQAVAASGFSAWDLESLDVEPGLGNGGLGRLAACLLDSLATLDMPAVGYGIRYEFGIFKQAFEEGCQVEQPDDWTFYGNPWEFPAPDDLQVVGFYGHTESADDDQGGLRARWVPAETVRAEPSHMLVPGYGTETVNIIRLWRARAGRESVDLDLFNAGRYAEAVEAQMRSENLTKVLYPSDSTEAGRELRLKQQYFLVSCSLRDIIRRFRFRNSDWETFPGKVVIQLNDTHPVLAIPELMRLLVDENRVGWDQALSITRRAFAYTCHTLLPEALETWPVPMFGRLLPRHLEIIYALNKSFLEDVRARYPGDDERIARMSLIQEGAWLCFQDESGQGLRPPRGRTWGRRGRTPVVKVTGGHDTRVSLAALIAVRPGHRPRLIYRTHRARRGDKRKGFTETDYARFLDAAHQQLGGPLVLVWDGLNTHTSRAMREMIAARDWLTVYRLPPYAPELNPVEMGLPQCELRRSPHPWLPGSLSLVLIGAPSSVQRRRL